MFDLPDNIKGLIYEYDPTYRHIFNLVLLEFALTFEQLTNYRKVIRSMREDKIILNYFINKTVRVILKQR